MRSKFDEQLDVLKKELISMGALCENAIALSAKSLMNSDCSLAEEVFELSSRIDRKERDTEGMCLRLILQRQPVARDLRTISSALKMITDMKRIGTQSAEIAEIAKTANIGALDNEFNIRDMAVSVIKMVTDSIDAFVKENAQIATAVIEHDDVVDGYFDNIKKALIEHYENHKANGEFAIDLLMVAKYLERIGDHAVNIAKWVLFSINGNRKEENE